MSFSVHIDDDKKEDILEGLEHTLTTEKMYLINFIMT